MIRKFNTEDFYNKGIETEKAKEYVAELQKAYDRLYSLVTEASKFFDSSREDSECIFEYMDIKDSFLDLISDLLVHNHVNVFDDSVYSGITADLREMDEESGLMKEGDIGLYDIDNTYGGLSLVAELDSFVLNKEQEKILVDYAKETNLSRSIYFIIEADKEGEPTHLLATFHYDPANEETTFLDVVEHSEMMYVRNETGFEVWRTEADKDE